MKIVANSKQGNRICYLQVKDFLKLARTYNDKKFIKFYTQLINNGKGDNDFVNVSNTHFINKVIICDSIADLNEFVNMSIDVITSHLVQLYSFDLSKNSRENQADDLRDIISFKKGDLEYPIPIILNNSLYSNDGITLYSSIVNGFFIIRSCDFKLDDFKVDEFMKNAMKVIIPNEYACRDDFKLDYNVFYKGDVIIISVSDVIRKKGIIERILSKIKRS